MKTAVTTTELVKKYGNNAALNGLTVSIPAYVITGMVGANGAGKTTWMMAVAGFLKLNSGTVNLLNGGPFNAHIHRGRISILPQDSALPKESRPLETLAHYGRLQGLNKRQAVESARGILREVNLEERLNSPIHSLSHGMRKRVMIAQCFIGDPELILLDEPLSGLDPREIANMRRFITGRKDNQTIIISSHNLHDLELLCDYVVFIKNGKTVRTAPMDDITEKTVLLRYTVSQAFDNLAPLARRFPDWSFSVGKDPATLCCRFNSTEFQPDQVNAQIIPVLMQNTGIISIERGASFEKQALGEL